MSLRIPLTLSAVLPGCRRRMSSFSPRLKPKLRMTEANATPAKKWGVRVIVSCARKEEDMEVRLVPLVTSTDPMAFGPRCRVV